MKTLAVKQQAKALVDQLPANASWEDLMYEIYVQEAVAAGLKDADAGRVVGLAATRRALGLAK